MKKSLDRRLENLRDRLSRMRLSVTQEILSTRRSVSRVKASVTVVKNKVKASAARLDALDPDNVTSTILANREYLTDIQARMQSMHMRIYVASEVSRYVAQEDRKRIHEFTARVVGLFDRPDEWWHSRKGLTCQEWAQLVLDGGDDERGSEIKTGIRLGSLGAGEDSGRVGLAPVYDYRQDDGAGGGGVHPGGA